MAAPELAFSLTWLAGRLNPMEMTLTISITSLRTTFLEMTFSGVLIRRGFASARRIEFLEDDLRFRHHLHLPFVLRGLVRIRLSVTIAGRIGRPSNILETILRSGWLINLRRLG